MTSLKNDTGYNSNIPSTVKEASQGLRLSVARHNEALLDLSLTKLIEDLCAAHGANWPGSLKLGCVDRIKAKYWFLTIEEVAMIFSRSIDGYYGKIYGQLKVSDVMEWIHNYDVDERTYHFESDNARHKESNEQYFRESEHKDAIDLHQKTKEMTKKFQAAKNAKNKVDKKE